MVCKLLICDDAEEVTICGQNQTDVQLTTAAPENLQENVLKEPLDKKGIIEKLLRSQPINIPVFHKVALRLLQMMNAHSYKMIILLPQSDYPVKLITILCKELQSAKRP